MPPTTISLLDSAQDGASTITTIKAGEAFTIISEEGKYFICSIWREPRIFR